MLNLPIDDLIQVSAGLFGLIFGIIFLSDGWYDTPEDSGFLGNSPKIRGLLFLLGGSVIPILMDLFSPAGDKARGYATVFYAVILGVTTVVGVFILASYAFIISANRIHDLVPSRRWLKIGIDSLRFTFLAVRKGSTSFYVELNKEYSELGKLHRQREDALIFFNGIYSAMVDNNVKRISGVDAFARFVVRYLELFIDHFLIAYSDNHVSYRACIYFYDKDNNIEENGNKKLYYFVGVDPTRRTKFSQADLELEESFAGWVLQNSANSSRIYQYVRGQANDFDGNPISFQHRIPTGPYKSMVAYAIQPLIPHKERSPRMIMCVDCSKENLGIFSRTAEGKEFIELVLPFVCSAFATAQESMDVPSSDNSSDERLSVASWIRTKRSNSLRK